VRAAWSIGILHGVCVWGIAGSSFNLTFWLYLVIPKFKEVWFLHKFSCSRSIEMGSNFALQSAWSRGIRLFFGSSVIRLNRDFSRPKPRFSAKLIWPSVRAPERFDEGTSNNSQGLRRWYVDFRDLRVMSF
jgi:hypothetical protein